MKARLLVSALVAAWTTFPFRLVATADDYDNTEDMFGSLLMERAPQILEACQVDYNAILESSTEMMGSLALTGGETSSPANNKAVEQLEQLAIQCTGGQAEVFDRALDDFQTCSSIDLHTVLESFADALLGTLLQCSLALAPLADQMDSDPAALVIPDICLESFMGQNPVGDLVRSYLLFPDKLLPCFSSLSKAIPECTLEEWPIPLIGKLMKKIMCILGETVSIVDELAQAQILFLSTCLQDGNPCEDNLAACSVGTVTLQLPKPLQGAPLSDAMVRAASQAGQADIVKKYNTFVEACIPDRWAGWNYEMGMYHGSQTYNKQSPPAEPQSNFMQEQAPPSNSSRESSTSSFGPFLGGLVTGLILVGSAWTYYTLSKKGKNGAERYQSVELVSSELALT